MCSPHLQLVPSDHGFFGAQCGPLGAEQPREPLVLHQEPGFKLPPLGLVLGWTQAPPATRLEKKHNSESLGRDNAESLHCVYCSTVNTSIR